MQKLSLPFKKRKEKPLRIILYVSIPSLEVPPPNSKKYKLLEGIKMVSGSGFSDALGRYNGGAMKETNFAII